MSGRSSSRGCSVSSAARSRKLDRKPCGAAATFNSLSSPDIAVFPIGLPPTLGNTSGLPRESPRASSRFSRARRHSGTRCSRFPPVPGPRSEIGSVVLCCLHGGADFESRRGPPWPIFSHWGKNALNIRHIDDFDHYKYTLFLYPLSARQGRNIPILLLEAAENAMSNHTILATRQSGCPASRADGNKTGFVLPRRAGTPFSGTIGQILGATLEQHGS